MQTPAMTDASTTTTSSDETSSDETPARSGPSRSRRIIASVLIVLATFLTFGTAADVWVKQQLLSTPRWVKMSDEIIAQPKVQAALATYLVDEIYANVDVDQALAEQLPDNLKGLAGPLSGALRGPASTGIEKVLASSQVQRIWHVVNENAHRTLVAVLEDDMKYGSSADGKVVLDLAEIVKAVATQMGLPSNIVDKIPASAGQITIFQSDQLSLVQRSVALLRLMGPILIVVILAFYALAVWLNRGRRIRTLRNIGWSIIVVGVLLIVLRKLLGNVVVSMIPTQQYVPVGGLIWSIVTRMIRQIGWMLVTWGALVVLGMILVGPSRAAVATRRFLAPFLTAEKWIFWVTVGVLYLLAVLTSPSPALQVWWSVLLVGALAAVYLEIVRRRTLVEFPDRAWSVDGFEGRAAQLWGEASGWAKGVATKVTTRSSTSESGDSVAQLQRLVAMHESGALSDDEFAAAKRKLLD